MTDTNKVDLEAAERAEPPKQAGALPLNRFDCVQCGTAVRADEEGCCATCGYDCKIFLDGEFTNPDAVVEILEMVVEERDAEIARLTAELAKRDRARALREQATIEAWNGAHAGLDEAARLECEAEVLDRLPDNMMDTLRASQAAAIRYLLRARKAEAELAAARVVPCPTCGAEKAG